MLGTLAAPSLLGSCTGSEGDKAAGISFAMNYFKVSEGDLRKVLAAALEKAGIMPICFSSIHTGTTWGCRMVP